MAPVLTNSFNMAIGEYGQDYAVPVGTPIYSPVSGTVSTENNGKQAWGKRAIVNASSGLSFAVGHLTQFAVAAGQKVKAGQLIGYSGGAPSDPSSGVSTGPHVETQFFQMGSKGAQYINPADVFKQFPSWLEAIFNPGAAVAGAAAGGAGNAVNSLNPLADVGQAIGQAANDLQRTVWRIGFFVLGFAIAVAGLWLIVRGDVEKMQADVQDQVEKATSTAAALAPEAAVAA